MERDEAAKTGLPTKNLADYRIQELLKAAGYDLLKATIMRYAKMFEDLQITSGRVGVYGKIDAGAAYSVFLGLQQQLPNLEIVGQVGDSLIMQAMTTKDFEDVARIREMGRISTSVVGNVADFLASHRTDGNFLVNQDGSPLLIGDVKKHISLWLAEAGVEDPEGVIFSIGRDAGVPHSSGNPKDRLELGRTIVFDIFPCEAGGGYFYDFTRTWCLGYAADEVQAVYDDVLSVFNQVMSEIKVNMPCRDYQLRTCELFEAMGHPTIKSDPTTVDGYVHGLGHGVGMNIHEYPQFSLNSPGENLLAPGSVVSVEPGLYYPERGMGVRIEDTVWVRPDGQIEILANYPYDLVIPVR
jgi:Xaa-Pro aminopeptidase